MNTPAISFELCAEKRIIPITDEVGTKMLHCASEIIRRLLLSGAPDVNLYISSGGGDVTTGLDIFDLVSTYPGKTTGIVFSQAASMAAIILQACDLRLCTRHGQILIHHISRNRVSFDVLDDPHGAKMRLLRLDMRKRQKKINELLARRTQRPVDEVRKACKLDRFMDVDEAIKFGLVDRQVTRDDMKGWFRPELLKG